MHQTEIIQFNVYTDIIPNGRQIFYLESFNGKKWESVFDNKNRLDDLLSIAKKIVQLAPKENAYKRIIFSNGPLDKSDGQLEGITLNSGKPYLTDSLTRYEKLNLLDFIQKEYN